MKRLLFTLATCCVMCACEQKTEINPFFTEFQTEYGAPDFTKIRLEHYEPAFLKGIEEQNAEIKAIVDNPEEPTFENTIVALDKSGGILARVSGVFFALTEADTNDSLTALNEKMAPVLSEHSDNIYLNQDLYKRVADVHQQEKEGKITLTTEQHRLLDKYYKAFVRSGAGLDAGKQSRLREINKELSTLGIAFDNHILNENNAYQLVIENEADLAGLPEWVKAGAAEEAKAAGKEGKWLFTLQNSSRLPFLQYAENRELRKNIYEAYINRGNHDDANDNKEILGKIMALRLEQAKLLGFDCYSNFVLDENMAKNSQTVMDFLNNLWGYSLENAKKEAAELQKIMDKEGKGEELAAWDWWYYAEKLRQEKYDLNEDEIKPYFSLEDVRSGLYTVANKLYGITLTELNDVPVYEPDVKVYEVKDADGSFLGLFYADYFPRAGKRGGAWMSNFREQAGEVRPLIYNVASFTKPAGNMPSLLTLDEVETMFHEFGHALHGMLTKCNYKGVSGTSVAQDFVELPSQIMENFAIEKDFLNTFARHYQTGEVLPDELIQRLVDASNFNVAYACLRQISFGLLDMAWYTRNVPFEGDVKVYEQEAWKKAQILPVVKETCMSTQFSHIFAGGYSAGYYSYKWAEVLDADAFSLFKQKGIFNQDVAESFRNNILSKGGTEHPMVLYKRFRGQEPSIHALLKRNGIIN